MSEIAAITPDEFIEALKSRRQQLWRMYLNAPNGNGLEALRQGKFEGFDEAIKSVGVNLPRLIAEAEERGAARVRERVERFLSTHACRCADEPERDCPDHGDAYAQHLGGIFDALRAALPGDA